MEKCEGVPEIVRFKNVLDDTAIPWIYNEDNTKIVFCRHGFIFEIEQVGSDNKPLSLTIYGFGNLLGSRLLSFNAADIIPFIDNTYGPGII